MNIKEFRQLMAKNTEVEADSELFIMFNKLSQQALKITNEINNKYNTPKEITALFSKLTVRKLIKHSDYFPRFTVIAAKISR